MMLIILFDNRFVRKVYELDPSTTGIPWQPRGYVSKRKNLETSQTEIKTKKICTPLLEEEVCFRSAVCILEGRSKD